LIYLQYPEKRNFDEFHYIPSALQWLGLKVNQNWEHPPLAKQLISLGLWIFGDVGIGWRFASTLFGAITLLAVFLSSEILFKSVKWAWITSFLTLFNFLLYVQSRIAMLDTFMMAFLALSFWAALKAYEKNEPEPEFRFLNLAGLFMGLAVACKWFSFIPYGIAGAMMAYHFFQAPTRMRFLKYVIAWIGVPVLAYYVTYIPYLWIDRTPPFSVLELLGRFQLSMWHGQKSVGGTHPYQSVWWSWPLMTRPIWYAYDAQGELKQTIRGVLLLGNPLIMWGGLVAVVSSVIAWVRKYNRVDTVLLALYFGMLLSWAVIPRKLTFYYYYYPNGILLSYFVTRWLKTINRDCVTSLVMGLTFGLFVYFFPILSAMPIP
ncbi:MAG: phospholipid carrier-dependent glycosyltransferase, partial [Proteobacteria bacterium]